MFFSQILIFIGLKKYRWISYRFNFFSRTNAIDLQENDEPTFGHNLFNVRDLIEGYLYNKTNSNNSKNNVKVEGTGSTFEQVRTETLSLLL